jgi:hypothetical protein
MTKIFNLMYDAWGDAYHFKSTEPISARKFPRIERVIQRSLNRRPDDDFDCVEFGEFLNSTCQVSGLRNPTTGERIWYFYEPQTGRYMGRHTTVKLYEIFKLYKSNGNGYEKVHAIRPQG